MPRRPVAAVVLLAVLLAPALAGCTDGPAPADARVSGARLEVYDDDVDCDFRPDKLFFASLVPVNSTAPIPFEGRVEAALSLLAAGDPAGPPVQRWALASNDPEHAAGGKVSWWVDGRTLQPGASYRIAATVAVAGGSRYPAAADFRYELGAAGAGGAAACAGARV